MRGNLDHLRGAIREFDRYINDPANYTPESGRTKSISPKAQSKKSISKGKPTEPVNSTSLDMSQPLKTPQIIKNDSSMPSLHIDIQIHISPQASDPQIDKVFESMAKHLKDLYNSTK